MISFFVVLFTYNTNYFFNKCIHVHRTQSLNNNDDSSEWNDKMKCISDQIRAVMLKIKLVTL